MKAAWVAPRTPPSANREDCLARAESRGEHGIQIIDDDPHPTRQPKGRP